MAKYDQYFNEIRAELKSTLKKLPTKLRELATEYYFNFLFRINANDQKGAYLVYKNLINISPQFNKPKINKYFSEMEHEDVLTANSSVLIKKDSPFYDSLSELSKKLSFNVVEHDIGASVWTKDYVVSGGTIVFHPGMVVENREEKLRKFMHDNAKKNDRLYYGKLKLYELHTNKNNNKIKDNPLLLKKELLKNISLEGGNMFCAVNKYGEKYYIVGENALAETMAYSPNLKNRIEAKQQFAQALGIENERLLIIPQWAYHIDLQMCYLGRGQFVIHSFDQNNFDYGLSTYEEENAKKTFAFLKNQFEKDVIDRVIIELTNNGFEVTKGFATLFYLTNLDDEDQLKFVPYCKNDENCGGLNAIMQNGFAVEANNKRYFITTRCDNPKFKAQFENKLKELGVKMDYIDTPKFYEAGEFSESKADVFGSGVTNLTQYLGFMTGGLRCQTSIVNNNLLQLKPNKAQVVELENSKSTYKK